MALSLDNFVTINIEPYLSTGPSSTQETVAYIIKSDAETLPADDVIENTTTTDAFIKTFFSNGGKKIKRLYAKTFENGMAKVTDEIVVATTFPLADIETYLGNNSSAKSTHIFVKNTKNKTAKTTGVTNLVLKYGTDGIEGTIAAHLSKINVDRPSSFSDYAFTLEDGIATTDLINDDTEAKTLKTNFVNFNTSLITGGDSTKSRALYGDDTTGKDFTNSYVLILLQRTLKEALVSALVGKLRYTPNSLSIIRATISRELDRYVNLGYLSPNKVFNEDTYYADDGRVVISRGTVMTLGYVISVAPFSTLTPTQKKNHEIPTINIMLGESTGIRMINISGKVA